MSRELVRDQGLMLLLGSMRSAERLAAFLLNLSQRFVARGLSPHEFHLRMTRDEIGSYLGLSLETVSRLFSRFQDEGLVRVAQKHIRIRDVDGLGAMRAAGGSRVYDTAQTGRPYRAKMTAGRTPVRQRSVES
jgi:CRP/FNR family transcriptional regulator